MIDKSEVLKAIEKSLINYYNLLNLSQYAKKTDLSNYQKKTDDTLKTTDKTIIGAINEIYDMLVAIIDGETNGIVSSSYDDTIGNLVLTASNGATITYNEATGDLSITNSSTTYDSATGNINIK